jgi:hypothetical protein
LVHRAVCETACKQFDIGIDSISHVKANVLRSVSMQITFVAGQKTSSSYPKLLQRDTNKFLEGPTNNTLCNTKNNDESLTKKPQKRGCPHDYGLELRMLFPIPLVAGGEVLAEEVGMLVVAARTAALMVASFQQEG